MKLDAGTSTFDGLSIAWAMTEYLHNAERIQPRTLFATHYHELTELEDLLPRVVNYSVAVRESGDTIAFLHKLVPGGCDHSYGIEVARLAGMPAQVIARAKEILNRLEQNDLSVGSKPQTDRVKENGQIPLFVPAAEMVGQKDHPMLSELRDLDVAHLTPVEALVKLDAWKRALEE